MPTAPACVSRRTPSAPGLQPFAEAAKVPVAVLAPHLTPSRARQIAESLRPHLRPLAALTGLRRLVLRAAAVRAAPVAELLRQIEAVAASATGREPPPAVSQGGGGRHWRWAREARTHFPVFVERLELTDESEATAHWRAGTLVVPLSDLPMAPATLAGLLTGSDRQGRLCVNWVTWKPSKAARLAPLVIEAIDAAGRPTFEGDERWMALLANAFWQPMWALGALRQPRGKTFPVALLPVRRDPDAPLDDSVLETPSGRIYGETSICTHILQRMASAGRLLHDPATRRFSYTSDKGVGALERAALERLNRLGFFDRFVAETPPRTLQVARVVPFQGAAPLSDVFARWPHQRGDAPRPVAGSNSTFFLNFPEECQTPHAALNDPAATLVVDGRWLVPPLFRRGTVLIHDGGRITLRVTSWEDVVIETALLRRPLVPAGGVRAAGLPASVDVPRRRQGGVQIFTAWSLAHQGENHWRIPGFRRGRDRAFVLVGTEIVEETTTGEVAIPAAGWVLVLPHGTPGLADLPAVLPGALRRVRLRWRRTADRSVRHAVAAGPLLLSGGRVVLAGPIAGRGARTGEQFHPWVSRAGNVRERGIAPTRLAADIDQTRAPRTALGLTGRGEAVLAVVDGRTAPSHSVGLTLHETALLMRDLGCREALNLDGGGSSILFVDHPSARGATALPHLAPGTLSRPSDRGGLERVLPLPLLLWAR